MANLLRAMIMLVLFSQYSDWSAAADRSRWNFTQSGFASGATIGGYFIAIDLDGDGWVSSFTGEILGFNLVLRDFAGTPEFTANLSNLNALVYDVRGDAWLGNDAGADGEGIAVNWLSAQAPQYLTGWGPLGTFGAEVRDPLSMRTLTTPNPVHVQLSVLPEPGSAVLLACALFAIGLHAGWHSKVELAK